MIVMLIFGAMEASNMVFLKQALTETAYEGARLSIREDATHGLAVARCRDVLRQLDVNGGRLRFSPQPSRQLDSGTPITVEVSAPAEANSLWPSWYFSGRTLTATVTMVRE